MRALLLCLVLMACAPAVAAAQTPATTPTTPATATTPAATTPGSVEINAPGDTDSADTSPAVVGLLVAAVLALLVLAAWGLLRLTAWEPAWLPRLRHAVGEAGYRFGGGWAQFRDWFSPNRR
jgi:hypothetical protein